MQTNTSSMGLGLHQNLLNKSNHGVLENRPIGYHNSHNQVGVNWFKSKSSDNFDIN